MAVSDFLEELHNDIRSGTMLNDVKSIFVHELFLYTVALFLKNKNYFIAEANAICSIKLCEKKTIKLIIQV